MLFCGDLTILLLGLAFHCFVIENRKSLCHSLGRPSRSDFVQFEFLGEQNYQRIADGNECTYTVLTYVGKKEERKLPEWKWVLDEYEYPIPETLVALRAILVIERDGMC